VSTRIGPRRGRVLIAVGSLVTAGVVGYIDGRASAYITFSIFYLVPVFIATWFVNRSTGIAVAVACTASGLAADIWTIRGGQGYAYPNLCLRLLLFVTAAVVIDRLHRSIVREKQVAEREREAAARLERATKMQEETMRSVARGAWEPLGEIYAKIVDLQFDIAHLSDSDSRAVLNEIAQASMKLSALIDTLLQQSAPEQGTTLSSVDQAS
jgi:hypothetical protein